MLSDKIMALPKTTVRYRLYRMRNNKPIDDKINNEIIKYFESQPGFTGWNNFAITWDVDTNKPFKVIQRKYSEAEEWNAIVRQRTPDL